MKKYGLALIAKLRTTKLKTLVVFSFILVFFYFIVFYSWAQATHLTVTVTSSESPPSCGDGSCNGSETCSSCAADCGQCGGGGGGSIVPVETKVIFKGKAYPSSYVTLLKDAQAAATTKAGADANFEISLSGLSAGVYTFGVWAEDSKGNRSLAYTFTISVTAGAITTVSGIFLPPTISIDKTEVKRGEFLDILGYSAPEAEIAVFINSEEIVKKTNAETSGAWLYKFDTLEVDYGDHSTRARSSKDGDISTFSKALAFKVGTKTVLAEPAKAPAKGDLNNDGRVNLIDFSILFYWFDRPNPPPEIDLNSDGKIDLVDFSIMAYYWTG